MNIFSDALKSVAEVAGDAIEIASTPVKVTADVAKQITAPVAEAAREISDLADDLVGNEREVRK